MEKKDNKRIIAIVLLLVLTIAIVISSSFAYYEILRNHGSSNVSAKARTLAIKFTDGDTIILDKVLPGQKVVKNFTVENIGDVPVNYSISLKDVINQFERKSDIVFSLTGTNGAATINNKVFPKSDDIISKNVLINAGVIQEYTMTIEYINQSMDQSVDMTKKLSAVIQILDKDEMDGIHITVIDENGVDLNGTASVISGANKTNLVNDLVSSGYISNSSDVNLLIDVESDTFNGLSTATIDVSSVASPGDKVAIFHFNETKNVWEYITTSEVNSNGQISGKFSSYSPVAIVKVGDNNISIPLYDLIKSQASKTPINFSIRSGATGQETNGIYTTTATQNNQEVYYYRGIVDNNIIFNNMCWKIIRTTETGGVKLIYNGLPSSGKCTASTTNATIGEAKYNNYIDDNGYVGYMHGIDYSDGGQSAAIKSISFTSSATYYYGTDYSFDKETGKYSLSGDIVSGKWSADFINYYTCKSTSANGTCTTLNYATEYTSSTSGKGYTYTAVKNKSTSYEKAHENKYDSNIKKVVDSWFSGAFTNEMTSKLEDTVYCNDRSTVSYGVNNGYGSSYTTLGYGNNNTIYGAVSRSAYRTTNPNPSLACSNLNDRFTVSSGNGNGKLTYPVGLITLDEAVLAGFNTHDSNSSDYRGTNYLYIARSYYTMTPNTYASSEANMGIVFYSSSDGSYINNRAVNTSIYIRPVISLKSGAKVSISGTGTTANPYVVK